MPWKTTQSGKIIVSLDKDCTKEARVGFFVYLDGCFYTYSWTLSTIPVVNGKRDVLDKWFVFLFEMLLLGSQVKSYDRICGGRIYQHHQDFVIVLSSEDVNKPDFIKKILRIFNIRREKYKIVIE